MRGTDKFDLNRCKNHDAKPKAPKASRRVVQGEGRAAYAAKLHMADNPYAEHTAEHKNWEQGFLLAFVDAGCHAA